MFMALRSSEEGFRPPRSRTSLIPEGNRAALRPPPRSHPPGGAGRGAAPGRGESSSRLGGRGGASCPPAMWRSRDGGRGLGSRRRWGRARRGSGRRLSRRRGGEGGEGPAARAARRRGHFPPGAAGARSSLAGRHLPSACPSAAAPRVALHKGRQGGRAGKREVRERRACHV